MKKKTELLRSEKNQRTCVLSKDAKGGFSTRILDPLVAIIAEMYTNIRGIMSGIIRVIFRVDRELFLASTIRSS